MTCSIFISSAGHLGLLSRAYWFSHALTENEKVIVPVMDQTLWEDLLVDTQYVDAVKAFV